MGANRGNAATTGLGRWLGGLTEDELAGVLRARPDALYPPVPTSIGQLAHRLNMPYSVAEAMGTLTGAGVRLVEVICALAPEASQQRVHELLGGPSALPSTRLADELDVLRRVALVWPEGSRLVTPGVLRDMLPNPLALGRPAQELLAQLTVDQLRLIGERYGLAGQHRKTVWVSEISAALSDPARVRRLIAASSPEARELVEEVAWHGPHTHGMYLPSRFQRVPAGHPGVEVARYGWVVPEQWGQIGEMPREVALAVRGEAGHPRLPAPPPPPAGQRLDPDRLLATSRASAAATLDGMSRLLTLLGGTPLNMVQTGGIGIRELRRAAKELHCREHEVRLWLEIAAGATLVTVQDGELLATEEADAWRRAEPAAALATLLCTWWELSVSPTHRVDSSGKHQPALGGRPVGTGANRLRADVLGALADLGESTAALDFDTVIDQLVWRRPLSYVDAEVLGPFAVAVRAEARACGLIADDALTPLGAALLAVTASTESADSADDPVAALTKTIIGLLPPPTRLATFLPDLTAVVAGSAAVELATLLDGCADAESRDVASTWRFSPASIRRALDAGHTADELLGELADIADKPLPQPLTYLVNDVARRHGQLQVRPVSCCVRVPDAALAAEVARHRSLGSLHLVALADTVLASSKPVTETLSALRAAGYAPVRQDATGAPVVERAATRRAKPPRRGQPHRQSFAAATRPPRPSVDPETLATRLLGSGITADDAAPPRQSMLDLGLAELAALGIPEHELSEEELVPAIRAQARQLSDDEVRLLATAIDECLPVRIDYLSASSGMNGRVVRPLALEEHRLVAWCELRNDERNFVLGRIAAVSPADN